MNRRDRTPLPEGAASRASAEPFAGFALPTSNTTYTPNQFFDVCLRHGSRGCVRVVAYVLRKTLGWSDADGNPQQQRFVIGYDDFQRGAGLSRGMIAAAVAEAVAGGYLTCLRKPAAKAKGSAGASGLYELRWDERPRYETDPGAFVGFFAGEGNRTYIPNQFFDHVVRTEPLAVVKVVGAVIRFSIGFQTRWGHRRQQIALSYSDIQRYARIGSRQVLADAIRRAVAMNYLRVVESGVFDPHAGATSRSATYAVRWLDSAAEQLIGMKTVPGDSIESDRSENRTGIGMKSGPGDRSENRTGIEITSTKNTSKQQPDNTVAASYEELVREGFDAHAAKAIASRYPVRRVLDQIAWLPRRKVSRNRLGLLRRAIEEDWPPPSAGNLGRPKSDADLRPDLLAGPRADVVRQLTAYQQRNSISE